MPVFIKLGQSQILHCDDFRVICKGPHKFDITKQLCDNAFRKGDLLITETLEPELKKSLTLHSTNFQVYFDSV